MIVVGIDEQPHSNVALIRAGEFAQLFGCDVHVIHGVHFGPTLLQAAGVGGVDLEVIETSQLAQVWGNAAEAIAAIEAVGVAVHRHDVRGYPPDVIVDFASENEARLIVIGSRGRSELTSFLLGSTSHRVLHFAPCDVLIVKE